MPNLNQFVYVVYHNKNLQLLISTYNSKNSYIAMNTYLKKALTKKLQNSSLSILKKYIAVNRLMRQEILKGEKLPPIQNGHVAPLGIKEY
jgi:hypothetical protein